MISLPGQNGSPPKPYPAEISDKGSFPTCFQHARPRSRYWDPFDGSGRFTSRSESSAFSECKQQTNWVVATQTFLEVSPRKIGEDDSLFDYMIFSDGLVQPPTRTKIPNQKKHKHQCWIKNTNNVLQVFTSSVNHFRKPVFLGWGRVGWGVHEKRKCQRTPASQHTRLRFAVIPGWWVSIDLWKLVDPYPQSGTTKINLGVYWCLLATFSGRNRCPSCPQKVGYGGGCAIHPYPGVYNFFWVPGSHKKQPTLKNQ